MKNIEIARKVARAQANTIILKHWATGEKLECQASWEKKVVECLNANKINFRWQHKIFTMPNGKTYRPDFVLVLF